MSTANPLTTRVLKRIRRLSSLRDRPIRPREPSDSMIAVAGSGSGVIVGGYSAVTTSGCGEGTRRMAGRLLNHHLGVRNAPVAGSDFLLEWITSNKAAACLPLAIRDSLSSCGIGLSCLCLKKLRTALRATRPRSATYATDNILIHEDTTQICIA